MPTREEVLRKYKPTNTHKEVPCVRSGVEFGRFFPLVLAGRSLLVSAAAGSDQVPEQQEPELHRPL